MKVFSFITIGIPFALASTAVSAQNLITDGGFESPIAPIGGGVNFILGQQFSKWTVVGQSGNVGVVNEEYVFGSFTHPARAGKQFLDITGGSNTKTGVQQRVQTVPGTQYTLTFSVGSIFNAGGSSTVDVLFNGVSRMTVTNFVDGGNVLTWKTFSLVFIADSDSTAIAFLNGDPPGDGINGLDAISLVPSPAN